jgi:hypothetical protein
MMILALLCCDDCALQTEAADDDMSPVLVVAARSGLCASEATVDDSAVTDVRDCSLWTPLNLLLTSTCFSNSTCKFLGDDGGGGRAAVDLPMVDSSGFWEEILGV